MRTMAAKLGTDAGRYETAAGVIDTSGLDARDHGDAQKILSNHRDKKAARRVLAELWVAPAGIAWDELKAPGRVLIALQTLGYVRQELTAGKVRMLSLTAWGRQQALKAIDGKGRA